MEAETDGPRPQLLQDLMDSWYGPTCHDVLYWIEVTLTWIHLFNIEELNGTLFLATIFV